ncbi:MAG: hypothetical protein K9G46_01410 [Flavobacteriales bacterium]|jgi:hypothetical protein|nr:hypothetical protein [Flavobacteriales bacterium]
MNFLLKKIAPLFFLGILLISSCAQTNISKLEGSWKLVWINDLADTDIYVWQFEAGELTIIRYQPSSPNTPEIAARAQYKTSSEFLDAKVTISGFLQSGATGDANAMLSNGAWTIDKINNEYMRLSTTDQEGSGGSYVIREFERAQ